MTDDSEPTADDAIAGLSRSDPLAAVSPLDGRYAGRTASLSPYVSEAALMRSRTRVEVEYLLALGALDALPIGFSEATEAALRGIYDDFSAEDARLIKQLETEGAAGYEATNHDVKAVEYFLRVRLAETAEGGADETGEAADAPLGD
ncbi:MAG: adenylosuccinate lyase, partial [Halorubrum sp.]